MSRRKKPRKERGKKKPADKKRRAKMWKAIREALTKLAWLLVGILLRRLLD